MFFNENLTFKEKPIVVIEEVPKEVDLVDYMDTKAMKTMLTMERDVFTIAIKEPNDPSTFIVPTVGQLNNWTCVGFSKSGEHKFLCKSQCTFQYVQ